MALEEILNAFDSNGTGRQYYSDTRFGRFVAVDRVLEPRGAHARDGVRRPTSFRDHTIFAANYDIDTFFFQTRRFQNDPVHDVNIIVVVVIIIRVT